MQFQPSPIGVARLKSHVHTPAEIRVIIEVEQTVAAVVIAPGMGQDAIMLNRGDRVCSRNSCQQSAHEIDVYGALPPEIKIEREVIALVNMAGHADYLVGQAGWSD